jgi:hypothetical protein
MKIARNMMLILLLSVVLTVVVPAQEKSPAKVSTKSSCTPTNVASTTKYRSYQGGPGYDMCILAGPGTVFVIDYISGYVTFAQNASFPEPPSIRLGFTNVNDAVHVIPTKIAFQSTSPIHTNPDLVTYVFSERVVIPVDFNSPVVMLSGSAAPFTGGQLTASGHYE